jgi:hypothetical protein
LDRAAERRWWVRRIHFSGEPVMESQRTPAAKPRRRFAGRIVPLSIRASALCLAGVTVGHVAAFGAAEFAVAILCRCQR